MMHTARRQILTDMGVTLWRLRVAPGRGGVAAAEPSPADDAGAYDVGANPSSRSGDRSYARGGGRSRSAPEAGPPQAELPQAAREAGPPQAAAAEVPWAVLSLAAGDVVLLVEGGPGRRDLRLAQDVLAAATGDWRARPARRPFHWPPPELGAAAVAAGPDAGARALRAFVDKDVADHRAKLLLCTEAVRPRLGDDWGNVRLLVMPSLERLGRDPEAKRALWTALAERAHERAVTGGEPR